VQGARVPDLKPVLRSPRTSDTVIYAYAIIVILLTRLATKGNVASPASIAAVLLLGRSHPLEQRSWSSDLTLCCRLRLHYALPMVRKRETPVWSSMRHMVT
jgi:hypothetical protein